MADKRRNVGCEICSRYFVEDLSLVCSLSGYAAVYRAQRTNASLDKGSFGGYVMCNSVLVVIKVFL